MLKLSYKSQISQLRERPVVGEDFVTQQLIAGVLLKIYRMQLLAAAVQQ